MALLFIIGGIFTLFWVHDKFGIFSIFIGILYMISAYIFYKYGFRYGNALFQIIIGISFIGLGISNYMMVSVKS